MAASRPRAGSALDTVLVEDAELPRAGRRANVGGGGGGFGGFGGGSSGGGGAGGSW